MSFESSHWCRSTPRDEQRPMESSEHQPTHPVKHRSTPSMESVASCETMRIMTHKEFAARHPHPPQPYRVTTEDIDRQQQSATDRHQTLGNDQQESSSVDRHPPFTYRVRLLRIVSRLKVAPGCVPQRLHGVAPVRSFWCAARPLIALNTSFELQMHPNASKNSIYQLFSGNSGGIIRNLEVQIGNALVPVDFHVLDIKLNWNSSLLLGRAFMATLTSHRRPTWRLEMIQDSLRFEGTINKALKAPIDNDHANEIDDFPEGSINSWENDYYQPSFTVHTATPSKRKIHIIHLDEYGVYRDEDGNTQALDGGIINVSIDDMEAISEMVDKSGGKYIRDEVMEIMKKAMSNQDKMYDKMQQTMDKLFYPLHNSIAWISTTMEELQQKLDYTE
ncbi:hypothetical protein F2Q70_00038600 [Brassica cretica]|uniref:Uncharacterized protein n=1 Tax=Brassica cretica TaxID=69181 RepID=A0A8S9K0N1_BRACR|nr:hypothetical protein F2Q70_00038600 [Brassica cretica]